MYGGAFSVITVASAAYPTPLIAVGQGSVLLYNTSTNVTVSLSTNSGNMVPGSSATTSPLGPGESAVFDGTKEIYGVVPAGSPASINVYPSATSYDTTQTPMSLVPGNWTPPSIPPNGGTAVGLFPFPVSVSQYNSYDLNVNVHNTLQNVAGAGLTCGFTLVWSEDLAQNVISYVESWEIWASNIENGLPNAIGNGPCHGAYLQVYAVNYGTAGGYIDIDTFTLFGSPRTVGRSDWRQSLVKTPGAQPAPPFSFGLSGFSPNDSAFEGVLCNLAAGSLTIALPANETVVVPFGLFSGKVSLQVNYSQNLAHNFVVGTGNQLINGAIIAGTGTSGAIWNAPAATSTYTLEGLAAAQCPLYAVFANGATAATLVLTVTGSIT